MAIADLLQSLDNANLKTQVQPIRFNTNARIKRSGLALQQGSPVESVQPLSQGNFQTPGSTVQAILQNSKINAQNIYDSYRANSNTDLAQDILKQSAGVTTNKFGLIDAPKTNNPSLFQTNLSTIDQIGKTALQGAEEKAQWQKLLELQNSSYSPFGNYNAAYLPPGASANNPGAQAIAVALTAYNNHTPYVWGGNSLTKGVDCASLVQLAYAKIGIKLPRTSYEQAKHGQVIKGIQNALPGDLIFYNTGSRDPNGIGVNSHVAIYLGNGMILEAANSRAGIRKASVNYDGTPSTIVRPWS
jgi:cell wall-associated NlpC family hydrolase